MDILSLEAPDTLRVHLQHPDIGLLYSDKERTKPVVITVYGPGSEQATKFERKYQKKLSQVMSSRGMKGVFKIPPEEQEQTNLDRLVALTHSVENMEYNGQPVTVENIREIYENPKLGWIRTQVAKKTGSWDEYLGE
jgi:hypothetical protein